MAAKKRDSPRPGNQPDGSARRRLVRAHLRWGWWSLLVFLTLGAFLETLHGFKAGFYLDASSETRRLLWTLAHAHGALLSLVHLALASFFRAATLYNSSSSTQLQAAHVNMQLAAFALSSGQPETAIRIVNDNLDIARASENAALLSTLLFIKAEAQEGLGQQAEAARTRREGMGWARYGFGSSRAVAQRIREIAALAPKRVG